MKNVTDLLPEYCHLQQSDRVKHLISAASKFGGLKARPCLRILVLAHGKILH